MTVSPLSQNIRSPETDQLVSEFRAIDTDGDEVISLDQANRFYAQLYLASDVDSDEIIRSIEIPKIMAGTATAAQEIIDRYDQNEDHELSFVEFMLHVDHLFARDHDGNRALTLDELESE